MRQVNVNSGHQASIAIIAHLPQLKKRLKAINGKEYCFNLRVKALKQSNKVSGSSLLRRSIDEWSCLLEALSIWF